MTLINLAHPKVEKTGFTCSMCKEHFSYNPTVILSRNKLLCNDCFEIEIETSDIDDIEQVAKVFKLDIPNFEQLELI